MYEDLPLERLRKMLVVAQKCANKPQNNQNRELIDRIIEELERAIWEKECAIQWKI